MGFEEQGTAGKGFLANFGRRQLIIVGTVLLIGAAVAVNWLMFSGEGEGGYDGYQSASDLITSHGSADEKNNLSAGQEGAEGDEATDVSDSYFASTQVSRQRARDEAIEVLQGVIDNEKSDDATKAQALADISQIARDMEAEANIETLIKSKGFEQCVAVINGDAASIVVKSDGLIASQISQINEIVYEQAGISPMNITIIQK
jgi:stage III sporulation protein AH